MFFLLKTLIYIDVLLAIGLGLFHYAMPAQHRNIVSAKVVAMVMVTPAVALFCGNFYLFCGYLVLLIAFNSRSRSELAANFALMLPLMPGLTQETGVGGIYLLAISAIVAMSLGALIGFLVTPGRRSFSQARLDISVVALAGIFMYIYNRDPSATGLLRSLTGNILNFAGPYLLISRGIATRADIDRLLLRLTLGGVLTSVTAVFQAARHWLLFETYYTALHVPVPFGTASLAMRGGLLRTGGTMGDYSSAGVFLAVVVALLPTLKPQFRRTGFWMVTAVLVGGIIAAQSRGGWLAAIVGLLFVLAFRRQWGKVVMLAGAGIAAELAILLFAKSGTLANIAGNTEEASGTVSYRKLLVNRGLDQIQAHPLFGQSPESLVANLPDLMQGQHIVDFVNSHLFIAMAAGVPLFLVWCYIWLAPVFTAWFHPARRTAESRLVEVPGTIIVPVMIGITATSLIDRNLDWPLIGLALAGPCFALARRPENADRTQRRRTRPASSTPSLIGATA